MTAMKLLILRFCIAGLLAVVLGSATVQAARLDDLFQAQVKAAGRDSASRNDALQRALQQVLVRVTGSSDGLQEPGARTLLQEPGRFIQQYGFAQTGPDVLNLWVQFDGIALAKEIRELGLPYWGADRPDVLVWLAVDNNGQRFLASEAAADAVAGAVRRAAQQRGLPVTLPLMDLQDQRAIEFTDVWGGFLGGIESASERYRPQVILIGKLDRTRAGGGWRSEWNLLGAASDRSWSGHAATLNQAVEQGIGDAAQWLALRYAVVAGDVGKRVLVVEGVRSLQDYARVYNYLSSLTPVDGVQVLRAAGDQVEFNLALNTGDRNLLQVIRLGRTLQAVEDPSSWRFRLGP